MFARSDFGEEDYTSVSGGLKVYFGADPRKSLIQRHRTEDPDNYTPIFPAIRTAAPRSQAQAGPATCPVGVQLPSSDTCQCPSGVPRFSCPFSFLCGSGGFAC